MKNKNIETSKFLSYVLRHKPESIGLELDAEGWADINALVNCAQQAGQSLDEALVRTIVQGSDKQRFTISEDGKRIRAAQGHTTSTVSISHTRKAPPATLYHGTATRFLDSILREGLKPGQRQHVHLSDNRQTALAVGKRYGTPVILCVAATRMHDEGVAFFQAENGVWLTDRVPPEFLSSEEV